MRPAWNLPDIEFVPTETSQVEEAIFRAYEEITGRKLYPGNPERLFLEAVAYVIAVQRFQIDYAAKMNLLSYATGPYLDHLGALLGVSRLPGSPARATVRFSLEAPLSFEVRIPAGTRVTPNARLFFRTLADAVIPPGQTSAETQVECEEVGAQGNGYLPGQIDKLVDPVPYVTKVENTTLTLGGSDPKGDEHFRERIRLAAESPATGSADHYRFHALSVSPSIVDAAVWSPEPGRVQVAVLLQGGEIPTEAVIAQVFERLNQEEVRPLTDTVQVRAPEAVPYRIEGTFYVNPAYARTAAQIVTEVRRRVEAFVSWQRERLGRDVNPAELIARVQSVKGVSRVELTQPRFVSLAPWQVALCEETNLLYGGLDA